MVTAMSRCPVRRPIRQQAARRKQRQTLPRARALVQALAQALVRVLQPLLLSVGTVASNVNTWYPSLFLCVVLRGTALHPKPSILT